MSQSTCNSLSRILIIEVSLKQIKVLEALVEVAEQHGKIECLIKSIAKQMISKEWSMESLTSLMIQKE